MFRRHETTTATTTDRDTGHDTGRDTGPADKDESATDATSTSDDAERAATPNTSPVPDPGTSPGMGAHRFDAVSALLGIATLAGAAIVIGGELDPLAGQDTGVWITGAAVLGGIAILPWGARSSRRKSAADRVGQ